jgi:UDP-glucose 4-epimerase
MKVGTRVLVTGASGFIGTWLLRELGECGAEVTALSREHRADSCSTVRWIRADLEDADAVDEAFATALPEVVFHLASLVSGSRELEQVRPALDANLTAAVNLLVAATRTRCQRVVLAGSMEEPDLEKGEVPGSPYAAAKAAQAVYARLFGALYETPVVVARIFMVYGPGQSDLAKVVPYSILRGLSGRAAELASGVRAVDWIHVHDVARGLVALGATPGIDGQTIDLGSGTAVTVGDMVGRIAVKLRAPPPSLGARPDRPLERTRCADLMATEALIGFRPEISLDEGLDGTIDWYRARQAALAEVEDAVVGSEHRGS